MNNSRNLITALGLMLCLLPSSAFAKRLVLKTPNGALMTEITNVSRYKPVAFEPDSWLVGLIADGKSPLTSATCGCYYRQAKTAPTDFRPLGEVAVFGIDQTTAMQAATNACIEVSAGALARVNQTVSEVATPGCEFKPVQANEEQKKLLAGEYTKLHDVQQKRFEDEKNRCHSSAFVFSGLPKWSRVLLSSVIGGYAWRARGGANPWGFNVPGGTTTGRLFWVMVPFAAISYISSDCMDNFVDGMIASSLIWFSTLDGWGEMMDIGRSNKWAHEGSQQTSMAIFEDTLGMSIRMGMESWIAGKYLEKRGYEGATLMKYGGFAGGGIYAGAWEAGGHDHHLGGKWVEDNMFVTGPTEAAEFGEGMLLGSLLSSTLLSQKNYKSEQPIGLGMVIEDALAQAARQQEKTHVDSSPGIPTSGQ